MCGKPGHSTVSAGRILGGENAKLGEIPWHLLIKSPRRGGASLINDQWAVTAAHVVEGIEEGSLQLYGGTIDGRIQAAVMDSERIIIHPGYPMETPGVERSNFDNDIALIKFTSRVNLGPNLLPICLPNKGMGVSENELGTVSGFGMTERVSKSPLLKYAHIAVYAHDECNRTPNLPSQPSKTMTFTNNMFCAGASGKDSCQGDSGGPFILPMLSGVGGPYSLTGIVSWGPNCRGGENKGYYTKVENYVDWIKNTVETA